MADIAFLLLIFFLVTTTMDVDKGLAVRLPPWSEEPQDESNDIKEKNIFVVLVNANNDLLVEDDYLSIDQLRSAAKDFIDNNGDGTFALSPHSETVAQLDGYSGGATFADYDNDGWPDLYVTEWNSANRLLRNRGDGTFEDVTERAGVGE